MSADEDFFIGWQAKAPQPDRRFLLGASVGLVAAATATGAGFAQRKPGPGHGRWNQNVVAQYSGVLTETPYPALLTTDNAGGLVAMLLVGYGKAGLPRLNGPPAHVELAASALVRGAQTMLAIADAEAFARMPRPRAADADAAEVDLGPAIRLGEILDAKCWFGAMNPGFGLTHKACAALCARGGLPLAFCSIGECAEGEDEVCLFLDERGDPHGRALAAFVADPIVASGRLVRRNGMLEYRVAIGSLRRA